MPHRIEIKFAGDAPDDELARARILGNKDVHDAIEALKQHLVALDLHVEVTAHTIRTGQRKGNSGRPKLVAPEPAAAE